MAAVAGRGALSAADLDNIERHTHTVYLIGDGGSFENARTLMRAAQALLRCGGLAVKVESAGLAHTAEHWNQLTDDDWLPVAPLRAFVTYVGERDEFYSCGMHNLGFRDAVLTARVPPAIAASTLSTFLGYIALEDPTIHDGETFSVDADAPRYGVTRSEQTAWAADDPFHNPYGVWRLVPL